MHTYGQSVTKQQLRVALLRARKAMDPAEVAAAQESLLGRLPLLLSEHPAATMTAYVPIGREPGGALLPEHLARHAPDSRLLLPLLRDDLDLDWAAYTGLDSLGLSPRGLREPIGPHLGVGAVARAGLVLVPALAVDHSGVRLGRGGGSFDRALSRVAPEALVVALLHDGELLDAVPAEPHDHPVDAVLTPGGFVRFS